MSYLNRLVRSAPPPRYPASADEALDCLSKLHQQLAVIEALAEDADEAVAELAPDLTGSFVDAVRDLMGMASEASIEITARLPAEAA